MSVRCAVLTISDSRDASSDTSGPLARRLLEEAAHEVVARDLVPDDAAAIESALQRWVADEQVEAIVSTGGTGVAPRDNTIEVVRRMLRVELEGFGELFRMLSYEQVGGAAMLSRAVGGLAGDTLLFALPGSPGAVELGVRELIAPQLSHLVRLLREGRC